MGSRHVVAQGEHLTGIAEKYGFRDFQTIWDHPDNAALKKARVNPHVLCPGDTVVIPEPSTKHEERPTAAEHHFRLKAKPLLLRIALKDFDNAPIAGVACELSIEGTSRKLTTDADGFLETPIPKDAVEGVLKVPELGIEHLLKIGCLDPMSEDDGWQARLINLGYCILAPGEDHAEQLRHAIEEFQCDHELKVTGEFDSATRAKLQEAHGS
jgi:N-acetylmuramoyl-L-alanine amidase